MDLNEEMELDRVIEIRDGKVLNSDLHAPQLYWNNGHVELDQTGWVLMDDYSGQYSYSGPVMHESEYIGGRFAEDILATDGFYVAVACYDLDESTEDETPVCGWAVARKV